ncbi:hypothetical protein PO909_032586, partial [Leuciscus waleckii]
NSFSVLGDNVKSSQVTFIYIALFTIQIVSNQLYRDNRKIMQKSLFPEEKNLGRTQAQKAVLLWPTNEQCMIMIPGQKSDWIGPIRIFPVSFALRSESSRWYGDGFVEDQCRWLSC